MKPLTFLSAPGISGASALALFALALPLTSRADRGGDPRSGHVQAAARAATPPPQTYRAPAAAAPRPSAPPQRPSFVAPRAAAPPVSRPSFPSLTPRFSPDAGGGGHRQHDWSGAGDSAARFNGSAGATHQFTEPRTVPNTFVRPPHTGGTGAVSGTGDFRHHDRSDGDAFVHSRGTDSTSVGPRTFDPRAGASSWHSHSGGAFTTDHHRFSDPSRFSHLDSTTVFRCYPRSHYRLCYGVGYAGRGYYFGPPNCSYYYDYPGVAYYSSISVIPAPYLSMSYNPAGSLDYSVQQALADRGYYSGPLDGEIGPMSRLAIANFQADNGLEPTGIIDETLLHYLDLE